MWKFHHFCSEHFKEILLQLRVIYCMPFVAKFKQKNSMFKVFYSKFNLFIQSSKCLFKVQNVRSKFKKFSQSSKSLVKVQNVDSKFKKCIESSKCLFNFQKFIQCLKDSFSRVPKKPGGGGNNNQGAANDSK